MDRYINADYDVGLRQGATALLEFLDVLVFGASHIKESNI
jgi:hypothetical protein